MFHRLSGDRDAAEALDLDPPFGPSGSPYYFTIRILIMISIITISIITSIHSR